MVRLQVPKPSFLMTYSLHRPSDTRNGVSHQGWNEFRRFQPEKRPLTPLSVNFPAPDPTRQPPRFAHRRTTSLHYTWSFVLGGRRRRASLVPLSLNSSDFVPSEIRLFFTAIFLQSTHSGTPRTPQIFGDNWWTPCDQVLFFVTSSRGRVR